MIHLADVAEQQANPLAVLPSHPTEHDLDAFEGCLLEAEMAGDGVDLAEVTWHQFADGQMARTVLIKAGTYLCGAVHKGEHLCVCSGDLTVWTVGAKHRLIGYNVLTSLPGARRVGYAHSDTYFTTVHLNPDNERDIDVLEERYVHDAHRLQHNRLKATPLLDFFRGEVLP